MKKLFILATAAVALASCSDSDLVGNIASSQQTEQPQAVEFGTYMSSAATRAGATGTITTPILKDNTYGFGVMGYQMAADWANNQSSTVPNFMYNQKIYWENNYWTYSPVKYWPNGIDAANAANNPSNSAASTNADKLNFFAYAPYVEVANSYASGDIKNLTLPSTGTEKKAFYTAEASNSDLGNGIAAIKANTVAAAPEVYYYMPTATTAAAVDLLWGLRGSKQYKETDATNNPATAYDNLGSTYNVNLTKQDVPETVNFLFKHALSKIGGNTSSKSSTTGDQKCGFKVVLDVDGNGSGLDGVDNQSLYLGTNFDNTKTLVTIKEVKIQDGKSATTSGHVTDKKSNLRNSGWFNLATGTWDDVNMIDKTGTVSADGGATYNIASSDTYVLNPDIAEPTTPTLDATDKSKWSTAAGQPTGVVPKRIHDAKNVFADTKGEGAANDVPALLMIPSDEAQTLYVTVDYFVRTADTHLSGNGYSEVEQVVTNEVSLTGLDVNKYYTLVMHLGLTSVKFSAVVADWANSDAATYDEGGTTDHGAEATEEVWLPSNVINAQTSTTSVAGTASNVNTQAETTEYTITLSGLATGQKILATPASETNITAVKIGENSITAERALVDGDLNAGKATIKVTLNANKKVTAKGNVLTITQKDASNNLLTTTTINIVQSAFDVVLAEATAGNVVSTKDGDDNNIDTNSSGYTVTVVDSEGANVSSGVTKTSGSITIAPAGIYTVTVVYNDGTNSITRVIDIHN